MKILVTGAGGFIGRHVLEELQKRTDVQDIVALTSKSIPGICCISSENYRFGQNYLLENACDDADAVLHMGAFIPKCSAEADCLEKTTENILSTQKMLSANFPKLKVFVYLSTLDVYKNTGNVITEQTPAEPATMYGWSKLYCEKMIQNHFQNRNTVCQILRIGHVYGEGEEAYRKAMPVMIEKALRNDTIQIYGSGTAVRTYIYVKDAAKAVVNALYLSESKIINAAGDEKISIQQLAEMIVDKTKSCSRIEYADSDLPERNYILNNTQMKRNLLERLTPFCEGLHREIEHMKNCLGSV